jgi:hypothetical protein
MANRVPRGKVLGFQSIQAIAVASRSGGAMAEVAAANLPARRAPSESELWAIPGRGAATNF